MVFQQVPPMQAGKCLVIEYTVMSRIWTFAVCIRAVVSSSNGLAGCFSQHAVYERMRGWKGGIFGSHVLCGRGKRGNSGKRAIYGDIRAWTTIIIQNQSQCRQGMTESSSTHAICGYTYRQGKRSSFSNQAKSGLG